MSSTPEGHALSPMQESMLYQSLLEDSGAAARGFDIEQLHVALAEALDQSALSRAVELLFQRHPVLSTSFHWDDLNRPEQRLNGGAAIAIETIDWGGLSECERSARRALFLERDRRRGFDLRTAPLMRMTVCAIDERRSELVWTFHHILLDGRSIAPLVRELFTAYDAYRAGAEPMLPPAPRPYSDYIAELARQDFSAGRSYFRQLLRGKTAPTPAPCAAPAGRPRPHTGHGEAVRELGADQLAALERLAAHTESTLGTVVQAAWALVLSRHVDDDDVSFGTTRTCRAALDGDAKNMVGLFINTLPARVELADDLTVEALIRDLRAQNIAMRPHVAMPLAQIRNESEIAGTAALFETIFVFESEDLNETLTDDARFSACHFALHERTPLPLAVVAATGKTLGIRMLFSRQRYDPDTVERLLDSLATVLLTLPLDPGRTLGEIPVLSLYQRRRILHEWNATARGFPADTLIHEFFEERVALQPDAIAVEVSGESYSYLALERRANRLAHALQARGAGPGVYVAICCNRGIDLITALLAVAKSGAAYVPLDPSHPDQRLDNVLEQSRALLVVTQEALRERFDAPVLVLDGEAGRELSRWPETRLARSAGADGVCYAIFTSGSSGEPKGVVLTHRAVVNTFDFVSRTFDCSPTDRLLFVTSPSFDLSVYDTFGALGAGATVVVATDELMADPVSLARALIEERITIWDSAPAALERIVPFLPENSADAALRLVMLSGDWIPLRLVAALRRSLPRAELVSLGGATEAAIWSNWFPIGAIDPSWTSVPYGRPIQNARYHVLDRRRQPVPVGVAGDLYIGGTCLAEGYLGRPDLTRERFVDDPFRPGERLYKTGDIARYFPNGELEFLGRSDQQVKIRGYRVELGEVESALAALPDVAAALCSAPRDPSGHRSIVAHVVPGAGAKLEAGPLVDALAQKLPDYMLPVHVEFLDALPISKNGKIDRQSVPPPAFAHNRPTLVPPRNETERRLGQIWEELLGRSPIGVSDDFFALGGHSLLAVALISRIKSNLGVALPLSKLLELRTIEALAAWAERPEQPARCSNHLLALNPEGKRPPLLLISGVGGYAFTYRDFPRLFGADQPVLALQAIGAENPDELAFHTIEKIAEIYEAEVLAARPSGPIVLGGFSFGILPAFELARRLLERGREVPFLVSFDGFAPGYPERLPLRGRIAAHAAALFQSDVVRRAEYLHQRATRMKARVRRWFGRDEDLAPYLRYADRETALRLRTMWAFHVKALEQYRPARSLPCAMLLIRTEAPERWPGTKQDDPAYGWGRFVSGPISITTMPGNHTSILDSDENQRRAVQAICESMGY